MGLTRREFGSLALGACASAAVSDANAAQAPGAGAVRRHRLPCPHHRADGQIPDGAKSSVYAAAASVAQLKAMHARLGVTRTVLVQPSFYGTDNSCMMDALAELGASARPFAVVPLTIADAALRDMDAKGVRGIRFNLETAGIRDPKRAKDMLTAYAKKVAPLNWHIQVYAAAPVYGALVQTIADMTVPVVIDHYGQPVGSGGYRSKGFAPSTISRMRARSM
jgi:predicted TIM-barrel fold metal-dependent hydrolase